MNGRNGKNKIKKVVVRGQAQGEAGDGRRRRTSVA